METFGDIRDPLIGTRIDGRYLVQGVLGRGGMGVVYDGVHEQLGRNVAIKVLGAGIAGDPTAVKRFLREARTASQLTHGNIVDVSDLGQLPDGRPYLVMAKMQGVDLATMLERLGPQTPQRTAELLRGAAAALDLIHAKGYVHRDVKPENLMHVVREDGSEAVLLLDFGIVGLVSSSAARLTAEGSVFGTPAYLPPEVIQGEAPDPRADVYALATVAFELITGRTPFRSSNPLKLLPLKIMNDAPSMAAVSGHGFPLALEESIAKSLARDPGDRHASAGAFVAALTEAALRHPSAGQRSLPAPPAGRRSLPAPPVGQRSSPAPDAGQRSLPAPLDHGAQGLDTEARARLASATSDLEMPLEAGDSVELLSAAESGSSRPAARVEPAAPYTEQLRPVRGRRGPWIALLALLGLTFGIWVALRPSSETPHAGVAGPNPVAASQPAHVVTPAAPLTQLTAASAPVEPTTSAPAAPTPVIAPAPGTPVGSKRASGKREAASARVVAAPPPVATKNGSPESANDLNLAAQRELIAGHLAAATDLYARATRVDPRSEPAWRGLGLAYERLGRSADAVRALRRAIELAPNGQHADALRARLVKLGASP